MKCRVLILWSLILLNCQTKNDEHQAVQLDIESNTKELSLLGENVISTPLYERDLAISPGGDQLIYTLGDYKQNRRSLIVLNKEKGNWKAGEILNISGEYQDIEPFYSNNGDRLYFASNRPIFDDDTRKDYNIWFSDMKELGQHQLL